ncbi:TetM/TetW/TetO/TetS family tetracycline resistance ribosomal protection protein [Ruminococcus sp. AF31-8BH]|nr:TetM/TetW/TetO/TetS family tetracycline resistance ribosomal protection protein [Ruminococcus sp. AF31-8BH]RGF77990.1 GTP-binding protein [Ruminococcus sp. AF31-8BH]
MKIINLGILAHVDAGKTTLTESLLYTSGAIAELGSVDEGTTRTDTMNLERQRGITIQTAVTSFQWEDVKVNIIDTPGHMDFLAEVYRSLSVLDGAVLLVSAKDGIQAQTRILFHALQTMKIPTIFFINKIDQEGIDLPMVYREMKAKLSSEIIVKQKVGHAQTRILFHALQTMKIPTIFFINKIDQEGIDLPMVYREMKAKLSSEIIVKQKVGQHPHINVTDNDDMEQWDAVIMGNDELLEKYMSGKPFKMSELEQEENRRFQNGTLFPVYHGSAKNNLGIRQLIEVIASKFYSSTPEGQSELCGQVFKIEYSEKRRRFVYVRIYSGTLHLRDVIRISEKEKIKITEMCVPTNGELYPSDTACSGDIVILPNDVLQLNSILGNEMLLPQRKFIENPLPMLQTTIAVKKPEQREILLGALTEISDGDPLLKYYVDTTTHEIILSFLGNVQMEVICAILEEKYHVEAEIKEPTVIYMERPLRKAEYTIHIEVPPNPFWASVGLSIEPLPIGSGVQYESRVSLGYLNQSFQNAVMEGVLYGCEQGLYGWKVTDCKICFEYGLYYSPVSTPADFRLLSPIVLEQALKKAGTELLEPYLHFEIYAPQEYLSRAYHDAPRYCADIVSTQIKNDEVILKGEIPARCIQEYRNDLTYFTNGQGVCLTELKGYQPAIGKFICQPRRPNSRIDKVRHMFHKLA